MDRSTCLVIIDVNCDLSRVGDYVQSLPDQSVHLSILVVGVSDAIPIWAYGAAPYGPIILPEEWQCRYQAGAESIAVRANEVEKLLQRAGVEGDVTTSYGDMRQLEDHVAARASLCDLVFLDLGLSELDHVFQVSLDGVLSKTPVGAVLNSRDVSAILKARHPMVAWDESLPAVRALHRALPILKQADRVTIAMIDPIQDGAFNGENPGSDAATWLSRHGCKVVVQEYPLAGGDVGHSILDGAGELGADLIVMGAYSHSRTRQRFFGGTTQIVIAQKRHPLFLAH